MENKKAYVNKYEVKPSTEPGFTLDTAFDFHDKTTYERDEK